MIMEKLERIMGIDEEEMRHHMAVRFAELLCQSPMFLEKFVHTEPKTDQAFIHAGYAVDLADSLIAQLSDEADDEDENQEMGPSEGEGTSSD
jgi:hypothetical protein